MKNRLGFVSNSSSSSFIVSVDKDSGPLHLKINIESECETITTVEELEKCEHFRYDDEEERAESKEYQQCLKMLEQGKVIKLFVASNEDENLLSGFHGHCLEKEDIVGAAVIIANGDY